VIELPIPVVDKIKPQEKQEAPKAKPIQEKVKMVALPNRPVVVEDAAKIDPPTIEDIKKAVIGPVTQDGLEDRLIAVTGTGDGKGTEGSGTGNGAETGDEIYNANAVELYPEFVGGMKEWTKFIQKNLRYPSMAMDQGKQGKVIVSFVVEKDGTVTNVTVLRGIGFGCDEEALRVINKSPKWKPGKQNGQFVRVKYVMPLGFAISQ
ncbi:MAG: energy transducer TonB, partial [Pedobacter sp.]